MGLPVPRAVEPAAIAAPWFAGVRSASAAICNLLAEPRSGRQLAARQADPRTDLSWPASGDDGLDALGAGNAPVVSRPGVFSLNAVLVLRRPRSRIERAGAA